jgi:hypothetical protein
MVQATSKFGKLSLGGLRGKTMKEVTYSDAIQQDPQALALVQRGTGRLEEIVGRSASRVSAAWDRSQDNRGRPVLTLRIWDSDDEATVSFTLSQLEDELTRDILLYDVWGDLLQSRNNRQVQALLETLDSTRAQHVPQD